MCVIIGCYRIGKVMKKVRQFENEYPFKFDIANPDAWREFLLTAKWNGKPLPRKDQEGNILFYRVYLFGGNKETSGKTLYPGNDKKGNRKTVTPFGRLDKNHNGYWKR